MPDAVYCRAAQPSTAVKAARPLAMPCFMSLFRGGSQPELAVSDTMKLRPIVSRRLEPAQSIGRLAPLMLR